jgi:ribonuclease P protein component
MTASFPRHARVRARAEFDRAFKQGRRTASPLFSLHFQPDAQPPRLGLAVSRKVDPHAVGRNRIKRVLRDLFRRLRPQLPGGDYVVVARSAAAASENRALRENFTALLQRAGALPQTGAGGTIAPAAPPAFSLLFHPASDDVSDGPSLPA